MLQALRDEYRIDLLTWYPVDLELANSYFGTALEPGDMRILTIDGPARIIDRMPTALSLLKASLLMRRTRRIAGSYELLVSANNEADFGRPGVQYIHYPWNFRPRPQVDLRWYHQPALLRGYYAFVDRLLPFDPEHVKRNLSLVNSDWTGGVVARHYPGIETHTVHPPVAGTFPSVPWDQREDGVVVLGRISPEKRVELAIEIVRRVRERGHALRLHVIGSVDNRRTYRQVRALARRHHEWVTIHRDLSRDELCSLVARQRYGLHAMEEEHFGIAVGEMVVAGLVPFVPDGGGQREIVACAPEVLWRSADEAVERIIAVHRDAELRQRIRTALAARAETLGTDHFLRRVRHEVAAFAAAHDRRRSDEPRATTRAGG